MAQVDIPIKINIACGDFTTGDRFLVHNLRVNEQEDLVLDVSVIRQSSDMEIQEDVDIIE